MGELPLVSVGLPTYNRSGSLRRAVESVLAQDYANLELVISDNASPDDTQAVCEEYRRRDGRVKYFRQTQNQGPNGNFKRVLAESRGEFFMWLADDDWLDSCYVSRCADVLVRHPDHQLVCGGARYFLDGEFCFDEEALNLPEESAAARVLTFYRRVGMNGAFYGLMRRKTAVELPIEHALGGDWFFISRLAVRGKVRTLTDCHLNRAVDGVSQHISTFARQSGLRGLLARSPHTYISYLVFKDILRNDSAYAPIGRGERLRLGLRSAASVVRRYSLPPLTDALRERRDRLRARLILRTRLKRLLGK
jgi:glycosyltransferase involved in cell wall biosynthesis